MPDIIFCCTKKAEFESEWNDIIKAYEINIPIIINDTNDSKDVFLIVFNRKAEKFEEKFEEKHKEYKNSKDIYVVFHGGQDDWNNFTNNLMYGDTINKDKHFFYSLQGGSVEEELRGKKVLKPLANAVRDDKSKLFKDRFDWLLQLCQGKTTIDKVPWSWASTINKILRSFLPLDIDMQALSDKKVDKEKYLQEMAKDLDELYSSKEKKNTHYCRKLYDLWYLLGKKEWLKEKNLEYSPELEKFTPIGKPTSKLYELAGIKDGKPDSAFQIHNFLMMLDTDIDILENKAKEICKPLHIIVPDKENNTTEEINTFHEWYCKLYEYLKKHEV